MMERMGTATSKSENSQNAPCRRSWQRGGRFPHTNATTTAWICAQGLAWGLRCGCFGGLVAMLPRVDPPRCPASRTDTQTCRRETARDLTIPRSAATVNDD